MKGIKGSLLAAFACLAMAAAARGGHNCLHFDGSNDYISVPHNESLVLTDRATFETWIKVGSFGSGPKFICTRSTYYGNPGGYKFGMWGSTMRLLWGNTNTTYFDVVSASSLVANAWTHVAVTYEGSTVKWYINGNLNSTTTVTPRVLNVTSDSLLFGKLNEPGYSYAFCGYLDRFRIWNCVRTQQEIQGNMNGVVPPGTAGLVAQFTFNQGAAGGSNPGITTLFDSSGAYGGKSTPIDGSLRNFALSGSSSNWLASDAPAAVELSSFDASGFPGGVSLAWRTLAEQGSAFWLVERGTAPDGIFSRIGSLPAAGNSAVAVDYEFVDGNVLPGAEYFYRIGEQELSGAVTWYGPVRGKAGAPGDAVGRPTGAWPNPFSAAVRLVAEEGSRVRVYDLAGRMVRDMGSVRGRMTWDGRDQAGLSMRPGIYFVRAEGGNGSSTCKLTKLR